MAGNYALYVGMGLVCVTEDDIALLPQPVRKYLLLCGRPRQKQSAQRPILVADAKGPDMDTSGLVTMFNDMCPLTPATLIDKRIQWKPIDSLTAREILEHRRKRISVTLYFNG